LLRKYLDIDRANVTLWLSSSAVLDRTLHSARETSPPSTGEEIDVFFSQAAQRSVGDSMRWRIFATTLQLNALVGLG
jgi:hypothetical protein